MNLLDVAMGKSEGLHVLGKGLGIVERACILADHFHKQEGQFRKYTGEPYIVHPEAVVALVKSVPHTPAMLAAAWLHDVVEDTPVTIDEIYEWFPDEGIAELVEMLTYTNKSGNRAERVGKNQLHTAKASPEAKTIKLADVIDNCKDIRTENPKFAKIYLKEKRALLTVLTEGDATLLAKARAIVL